MKALVDMTPEEVVEEYDRRGRREGWPPAEPVLLAKFRWAMTEIRRKELQTKTIMRAIRRPS
jgi:hypothetical protein